MRQSRISAPGGCRRSWSGYWTRSASTLPTVRAKSLSSTALMCGPAWKAWPRIRTSRASFSKRARFNCSSLTPKGFLVRKPPFPVSRTGMQRASYLFTSESVSEGHPDKVCDRISDEVVDAFFRLGPKHGFAAKDLRVACETLATTNRVVIAGETRGPEAITKEILVDTARSAIRDIGYEQEGFHWQRAQVEVLLH